VWRSRGRGKRLRRDIKRESEEFTKCGGSLIQEEVGESEMMMDVIQGNGGRGFV
jgi:hypothetical protein